jgi:hypothetical protein
MVLQIFFKKKPNSLNGGVAFEKMAGRYSRLWNIDRSEVRGMQSLKTICTSGPGRVLQSEASE